MTECIIENIYNKKIYEETLISEEIKCIAKEKIDSLHFKQLTGVYASKELRSKLIAIANYSQDDNIWKYIRNSIRFLIINENGLLIIREENRIEKLIRYVLQLLVIVCLLIFLLCVCFLIFIDLKFKFIVLFSFFAAIFSGFIIIITSQIYYIFSNKEIKKYIQEKQSFNGSTTPKA